MGNGAQKLNILHGAGAWETFDPDTSRIWWKEVGVHQNLTHAVHPDPISGAHCWLQKAVNVRKAVAQREIRRRLGGHAALDGRLPRVEGADAPGLAGQPGRHAAPLLAEATAEAGARGL